MMPSRGCQQSKELWSCSPAIWQMCVVYMVFFSISYVFFVRLAEDNVTGVESLLEQAILINHPTGENGTQTAPFIAPPEGIPAPSDSRATVAASSIIVDTGQVPVSSSSIVPLKPQQPSNAPEQEANLDAKKNDSEAHHDDIPSFNEWANKKMAEVEKNKGENITVGTTKLRLKNYASPDCGAKVVTANPEAVSPSAILSPSRDDYMLNPCNVKIWFVVELCESIQPQRVEIANFELFSSSPQDLSIWVSDRYPTRDWSQVATVQAKDERNVQSFPLPSLAHFAKYVKVELHSHYGSEHYCPVSLFKAFGTSELEVLDNSDNDGDDGDEVASDGRQSAFEEDDESLSKLRDPLDNSANKEDQKSGDDLFRTAKAAVLSIVQKAAQVLGNGGSRNNSCLNATTSSQCLTPGYQIVCNNCTDQFYYRLYEAMCCNGRKLQSLLSNALIHSVVSQSSLCNNFGIDFSAENQTYTESNSTHSLGISYLRALLGDDTLAALCNYLAVSKRKAALNVSHDKNRIEEIPLADQTPTKDSLVDVPPPTSQVYTPPNLDIEPTNKLEEPDLPISPTKTLPAENNISEVNATEAATALPSLVEKQQGDITVELSEQSNDTDSVEPALETDKTSLPSEPESSEGLIEPVLPSSPVETIQLPVPSQDEPVTVDSLALDSLFPELDEEVSTQDATTKATAINSPPVQKESVFVRLANRIKALEVNMSLSSQYLEELSRRYKKQVEELQRTLASMVEDRRLAAEREGMQAAQLTVLTQKTEALTAAVTQLLEERNQWGPKVYIYGHHGVIMLIEVVVLFLVLGLCRWLMSQAKATGEPIRTQLPQRRHSLDEPSTTAAQPKKRRPSEEAFIPSSSTHQELLIDGGKRKTSRDGKQKRKRRRKDKLEDGVSVISADGEEWIPGPPEFIRTAEWSRRQRASIQTQTSSSQETLGSLAAPSSANSSIKKKTGALKKIVKKLF